MIQTKRNTLVFKVRGLGVGFTTPPVKSFIAEKVLTIGA
jgi:hypothetical protein